MFEGIRGSGFEGDIAIDDVSITRGECKQQNTVANAGKTGKIFCDFCVEIYLINKEAHKSNFWNLWFGHLHTFRETPNKTGNAILLKKCIALILFSAEIHKNQRLTKKMNYQTKFT